MYEYKVREIVKVVDGDTVYATVSLGFHMTALVKLRIEDIDTPEINTKDVKEKEQGMLLKHLLIDKFAVIRDLNFPMTLKSSKQGKYGRWIGNIYWGNDRENVKEYMEDEMIRLGIQ